MWKLILYLKWADWWTWSSSSPCPVIPQPWHMENVARLLVLCGSSLCYTILASKALSGRIPEISRILVYIILVRALVVCGYCERKSWNNFEFETKPNQRNQIILTHSCWFYDLKLFFDSVCAVKTVYLSLFLLNCCFALRCVRRTVITWSGRSGWYSRSARSSARLLKGSASSEKWRICFQTSSRRSLSFLWRVSCFFFE